MGRSFCALGREGGGLDLPHLGSDIAPPVHYVLLEEHPSPLVISLVMDQSPVPPPSPASSTELCGLTDTEVVAAAATIDEVDE